MIFLLAALGACGGDGHRHAHSNDAASSDRLYSPNGEALSGGPLGHPSCQNALSGWFDRVDGDHDGSIDRDEYLADARRQFGVMDLDKDGVITPAELAQYRAPFEGGTATLSNEPETSLQTEQGNESAGRRSHHRAAPQDQGGGDAGDRPDPVMLADVNLRNKVSLADFLTYAQRKFTQLDTNHDGRLSKAEVLTLCP
jgi:Ca2+-binding EF-hand superfamily protein